MVSFSEYDNFMECIHEYIEGVHGNYITSNKNKHVCFPKQRKLYYFIIFYKYYVE